MRWRSPVVLVEQDHQTRASHWVVPSGAQVHFQDHETKQTAWEPPPRSDRVWQRPPGGGAAHLQHSQPQPQPQPQRGGGAVQGRNQAGGLWKWREEFTEDGRPYYVNDTCARAPNS